MALLTLSTPRPSSPVSASCPWTECSCEELRPGPFPRGSLLRTHPVNAVGVTSVIRVRYLGQLTSSLGNY